MQVWGGQAWNRFVEAALTSMGDITGKSVLEIGFHDGAMSREFARRGALVTAVEVRQVTVDPCAGVTFLHYDGNLDTVPGLYDFVFTKSVLVVTDLAVMLPAIQRKLTPAGRIVFIENGRGNAAARLARRLARPGKSLAHLDYFTHAHIEKIRAAFDVEVEYNGFPPVYLIQGHARAAIAAKVGSEVDTVTLA